jgi:Zn-finger nucleic acid-binding protein
MFAGSAYCPTCGTRLSTPSAQSSSNPCPGCDNILEIVDIGDISLLECRGCDGVWISAADFERVCADREARASVLGRLRRPPIAAGEPATSREIHYRPCLVCGKMMNRVNFERVSGTVIDVCRGHGAFLDTGELHAIATFIMEGGLDRARQREKEDLADERRRLELLRTLDARRHPSEWDERSSFGLGVLDLQKLLKED